MKAASFMMKYVLKKLPKTSVLSLALGVTLFPVAINKKIQVVNIGTNRVTANEDLARLGWTARGVPMAMLAFDVTATSVGPGLLTEQGNFGWASRKTLEPWLED